MKILVVDDKEENRYLLETLLKGSGYEVVSAANGAEALERIRAEGCDMIISDILMPIMDGYQFCREVKGIDELQHIPFVFYTAAYTDDKDEQFAFESGADRFIRKPLAPDEFIKIIKDVIRQAEAGKIVGKKPALEKEEKGIEFYTERMVQKLEKKMAELKTEIIERKRAEEELRRLRNLLANIVDSMPSVLVGVDTEGKIMQWNREAEKVTGVTADMAHGRVLTDVFPDLAEEMEMVRQAIRTRRVQKHEKLARESKGETRFSDVTAYPLIANGVEGAVIRVDDVTERVRIEEMMLQSEKMLTVGGLAAGMAHEINNPLAGIIQNLQVMRNRVSGDLPKNQNTAEACGTTMDAISGYMYKRGLFEIIESIMESGRRAAKIVDNMLSFSRKSEARLAPHDVCDLLDKTIELASKDYDLKKRHDFRRIEIVREYDGDMPQVSCEGSQIQQVFLNILKNGAQAMTADEIRTTDDRGLRAEGGQQRADDRRQEKPQFILRVMQEAGMARIEIEDNGPGMDDATRDRVFEPFFTTKGVGVGTGLGLSVSYFIITQNHGGTMAVESEPGKGAKFVIQLPMNI